MKHILTLSLLLCFILTANAQVPQAIKYQGVARNTSGQPLSNKSITVKLSIREASATGTILYQETHQVTTTEYGLYNLNIGGGTVVTGTFSGINWGSGDKFLHQEVDFGAGLENVGTSQFLSVPFALYAASGNPGPQGPAGANGISLQWLGTLVSAPANPTLNQAYYNSTDKKSYVYNGTEWKVLAQDGAPGILPSGDAAGNTPYWNGTGWVTNSSNIYNNGGNVAIGKTTAAEMLDVNGNIVIPAANEYKYAAAKTKYFTVPPIGFTYSPSNSTAAVASGSTTGTYRYIAGGVSGVSAFMFAPIHLPDGATLTRYSLFVYDNDATYDVYGNIYRINLSTNAISNLGSTNMTSNTPTYSTLTASLNSLVDNSQYAYYIRFNTIENSPNLRVLGAKIEYTVNKAE